MTRARIAGFGYVYVALALPAFIVGYRHPSLQSALYSGAAFAFFWFLASLRARLDRYDPEGFYSTTVVLGGAAFVGLQTATLLTGRPELAGPTAACAATVVVGASLAALRARKVPRWFGYAGVLGGVSVLGVGILEAAWQWKLAGNDLFASALGFMIWVLVATTDLLRR